MLEPEQKTGNFGLERSPDPNLETPTANTEARNHSPDRRKHDQELAEKNRKHDQELQNKLELEKQEKEKISNELVAREKALADEQDSKAKLENYLKELETKLVTGGDALAQKEKEQAQKQREFQKKLKE